MAVEGYPAGARIVRAGDVESPNCHYFDSDAISISATLTRSGRAVAIGDWDNGQGIVAMHRTPDSELSALGANRTSVFKTHIVRVDQDEKWVDDMTVFKGSDGCARVAVRVKSILTRQPYTLDIHVISLDSHDVPSIDVTLKPWGASRKLADADGPVLASDPS